MTLPSRPLTSKFLTLVALALWATAPAARLQPLQGQTQNRPRPAARPVSVRKNIPYVDAKPILETLRESLPGELTGKTPAELESAWPGWVSRENAAIRARLEGGDEDSIVYLWQYGTSFTKQPAVTERNVASLGGASAAETIIQKRLEDFIAGIASPGTNERLQFARRVIERQDINPTTLSGKDQVRRHLRDARARVLAELDKNERALESAKQLGDPNAELATYLTLFRERGLSSDTSVLPAFAIEQALETIKAQGVLGAGSVRRVAIVGPGLDFANKADGYDFYPQQTIQPFAAIDSLIRLGLAKPGELRLTTFDLSPRVNQHIEAARQRTRGGSSYMLHLPLSGEEPWNPAVVEYWQRLGDRIGTQGEALTAPPGAGTIRVRAVRVNPAVVTSIVPRDLNIVLERLEPLATDERFDLVIATNILVYYDVFEQSLALVNVARMLRPGGLFLSNTPVPPLPLMQLSARYTSLSYSDRQRDFMFWYQRQ